MKKFLLLMVLAFVSCQSRDGDFTIFSEEDDMELGRQIAAQIESNPKLFPILLRSDYPELYVHLEKIRDKILASDAVLHRGDFSWELKVIENDTLYNAFCTPGGYIYVYSGLIRFVQSEDELAGILAHEIAHGDLRHSTDQMTKAFGMQTLVRIVAGSDVEQLTQLGVNLLGLSFSRSDEEEADKAAVNFLNDTDYHPRAFSAFFKRMEARYQSPGALQFLSTHPNPENRIEKIETVWRETGSKGGNDHTKEFRKLQRSLP